MGKRSDLSGQVIKDVRLVSKIFADRYFAECPTCHRLDWRTKICNIERGDRQCDSCRLKAKDLTGRTINNIQILQFAYSNQQGRHYFCKCPRCGRTDWIVRGAQIVNGHITKCLHCAKEATTSDSGAQLLNLLEDIIRQSIVREYPVFDANTNRMYHYDGFVKDRNMLIEVDGKFWHDQEFMKKLDTLKNNLAEKANLNLIRIRCDDVKMIPAAINEFKIKYQMAQ